MSRSSSDLERNRAGGVVAPRTYGYDVIETAMVVHEWIVERLEQDKGDDYAALTIQDISSNYGSSAMRSIALQAGVIIDKCWDYQHLADPDYFDGHSWDWEFVPWLCRNMEWDKIAKDNQYGSADYCPDIPRFMAKLDAAKALGVD